MLKQKYLLPLLQRIQVSSILLLVWILIFQLARGLFYSYQLLSGNIESPTPFFPSAWHGLPMDISMAGYISVLPTLLLMGTARQWQWYRQTLRFYVAFVAGLVALIVTADLEVYKAWNFRLDTTPLYYLKHPQEALASASSSPLLVLLLILVVLAVAISVIQQKIIGYQLADLKPSSRWLTPLVFLFLTTALIIPIRGGLQLAPMNQSSVYFSTDNFANQLAVNASWNFLSSATKSSGQVVNPFVVMQPQEAQNLLNALRPSAEASILLLKPATQPNVLIIIWESLTAKAVASLGGLSGITPHFDSLARQGVLFTHLYASGDRSAKGMVAILSGYPAQPTTSIITVPAKTATLPSLPRTFKAQGYHNSFYYGGETEFANIKSYLLQQGFDRIIDHNSFDESEKNSKWGAHDHVLFNRLLLELDTQKFPFFTTLFTLSSHEPFEVPYKTAIPGQDVEHKFLNSLHYTDTSLGDFIQQAKTKPWWDNTLIVILADHGHPMPKATGGLSTEFRIPMLWLGGVVEQSGVRVDSLGSQTDVASTLLNQLGLDSSEFTWSNDLLQKGRIPYAFYSFNNGFGWVRPEGTFVYDNVGMRDSEVRGKLELLDKQRGKAYLQMLFGDYLQR
jgi:phosphoglycerol transferase MdoB-like AlkP superfamily enzyme